MKPVVFIPGFPASELILLDPADPARRRVIFPPGFGDLTSKTKKKKLVERLTLPDDPAEPVVAGEPIRHVLDVSKQAESLYDILRDYHYSFGATDPTERFVIPVGWDWRFGIDADEVVTDITVAIETLFETHHQPVVVIIHSTGGLVFRRLIELHPELAAKIDQILAFGVPWAGTLKAVKYVAKGEPFGFLFAKLSASEVRGIMRHCQAAWDLFPPDPMKSPLQSEKGVDLDLVLDADGRQTGALADLQWLTSNDPDILALARAADDRLGSRTPQISLSNGASLPPMTNIAGWGIEMDTTYQLGQNGRFDWSKTRVTKAGDGTVPTVSASWLRGPAVRTYFVPIGAYPTNGIPTRHPRIWDAPPLLEIFDQVLANKPAVPFVAAAADHDEVLQSGKPCTVRITAAGLRGEPLPDAKGSVDLGGHKTTFSFGTSQRAELIVPRAGLRANISNNLYRFVIDVTWTGGRRELPVIIRL